MVISQFRRLKPSIRCTVEYVVQLTNGKSEFCSLLIFPSATLYCFLPISSALCSWAPILIFSSDVFQKSQSLATCDKTKRFHFKRKVRENKNLNKTNWKKKVLCICHTKAKLFCFKYFRKYYLLFGYNVSGETNEQRAWNGCQKTREGEGERKRMLKRKRFDIIKLKTF